MKTKDILAMVLMIISILIMLFIAYYYATHSPEYITHSQFSTILIAIYGSMISGFFSIWLKLTSITENIGRLKGVVINSKK